MTLTEMCKFLKIKDIYLLLQQDPVLFPYLP
jgi:hypothetical protein